MRILTTDIYEGAYLLSKGAELKNIWRDDGKRKRSVIFEFTGSHVKILRENYILGKANANVLQLKEKVNILKDQLFKLIREYEIDPPSFAKQNKSGGLRRRIERRGD